jgi:glycosyltransferase involved in cell wall biosynthesis
MRVVITVEQKFEETPDGIIWTSNQTPYQFWQRYLEVFDSVKVVARVKKVKSVPHKYIRADGPNVSFERIPSYYGPLQFLANFLSIYLIIRKSIRKKDAVIFRVGSILSNFMYKSLIKVGHPYALEVIGDPWDVFSPGSVKHPLRPFFRWYFSKTLRDQCWNACAAAYVNRHALFKRYPIPNLHYNTHYSSVELSNHYKEPTLSVSVSDVELSANGQPITSRFKNKLISEKLIFVGTLEQLYKAPDILIKCIPKCLVEIPGLKLTIAGDGKHKQELMSLAKSLGVESNIQFLGHISSPKDLIRELDKSDLFVLPSYQEGLPRAMIEAMARGLPCIGTSVGGIPELLDSSELVVPGDSEVLADKIIELLKDIDRMQALSIMNINKSKEYFPKALREKRLIFYKFLRDRTSEYINRLEN